MKIRSVLAELLHEDRLSVAFLNFAKERKTFLNEIAEL